MIKKRDPKAFVTNEILDSAIEHVVYVMHKLVQDLKTYMDKRFNKIDKRFEQVNKHFEKLEVGQLENRRRIDDIKADIADTPTRKEFNELKGRVDKYHPVY